MHLLPMGAYTTAEAFTHVCGAAHVGVLMMRVTGAMVTADEKVPTTCL